MLYLSLFFVRVGGVIGTYLPVAAAVNNWFVSRRAMAMAVLLLPLVMVGFLFEVFRFLVEIDPRTASLTVAATVPGFGLVALQVDQELSGGSRPAS